jgi:hypothetical protein
MIFLARKPALFRWLDGAHAFVALRPRAHMPEPEIPPETPPVPTPVEIPPIVDPPDNKPPAPVQDPPAKPPSLH